MKKLIPNPRSLIPSSSQSLIPEKDILVHKGEAGVKMTVKTDGETVWLTQEQMCQLFGRDRSVFSRHIRNAFAEHELNKTICLHFLQTNQKGRPEAYYNLDVVIIPKDKQKRNAPKRSGG